MVEPWKGLARIDPSDPQTLAICDRCGDLSNLADLRPQYQWAGRELAALGILVCRKCWDEPSVLLATQRIAADPEPVLNARTAPFSIFEKNEYTLKPAGPGTKMFAAVSSLFVEWNAGFTLAPDISGVSDMTAHANLGIGMSASLSDTASLVALLNSDFIIDADITCASSLDADLKAGLLFSATFSVPSSISAALQIGKFIALSPLLLGTEDGDILATEGDDELTTEYGLIFGTSSMVAELTQVTP